MRKGKRYKAYRHQLSRERSEMKKRHLPAIRRRRRRLLLRKQDIVERKRVNEKNFITKVSPSNFSLVDNTDEVVAYINDCRSLLNKKKKVIMDIENVQNLSPDAIALLVACANDAHFSGKYGKLSGNAPNDPKLLKLFAESGFYKFVSSSKLMKSAQKQDVNLLHKESHFQVQPEIAKQACLYGTKHVFSSTEPFSDLYEMIVEAMSNTNNHANKKQAGTTKWWLYTYNDPDGKTCYSFIDLGVGIFDSLPVSKYKKVTNWIGISHNVDLVQDLLDGKIKSREIIDNNIRGKGIPQIARNSQQNVFGRAYIISNDVKINLKTRDAEKLKNNFQGTCLYWELIKDQKNG